MKTGVKEANERSDNFSILPTCDKLKYILLDCCMSLLIDQYVSLNPSEQDKLLNDVGLQLNLNNVFTRQQNAALFLIRQCIEHKRYTDFNALFTKTIPQIDHVRREFIAKTLEPILLNNQFDMLSQFLQHHGTLSHGTRNHLPVTPENPMEINQFSETVLKSVMEFIIDPNCFISSQQELAKHVFPFVGARHLLKYFHWMTKEQDTQHNRDYLTEYFDGLLHSHSYSQQQLLAAIDEGLAQIGPTAWRHLTDLFSFDDIASHLMQSNFVQKGWEKAYYSADVDTVKNSLQDSNCSFNNHLEKDISESIRKLNHLLQAYETNNKAVNLRTPFFDFVINYPFSTLEHTTHIEYLKQAYTKQGLLQAVENLTSLSKHTKKKI